MAIPAVLGTHKLMTNRIQVGTDIEQVGRFRKKPACFYKKIFTEKEIKYCTSKACHEQHFAARFAAKEAVIKAVSNIENLFYNQIEIMNDKKNRPSVRILKKTKRLKNKNFSVSLSHTQDLALAFVVYMED